MIIMAPLINSSANLNVRKERASKREAECLPRDNRQRVSGKRKMGDIGGGSVALVKGGCSFLQFNPNYKHVCDHGA